MDPFAAPIDHWQPLSPNYLRMKRLMVLLVWGIESVIACLVLGYSYRWWAGAALAVVAALWIAYRWHRQGRVYRIWGYAERETDLYLREGLWQRRLTVVPYGRMQVVTVNSGPIERKYGLATVTLETASAGTDATIPGLPVAEADRLRERLTELGEQQAVGL
ncbi:MULTISPECIES: PH domain-containing protein [unclassified Luteococcus]|uniref:PH domain-containing protein n=1 Tax=unclassified Luteococcus TaxID=2639923 RepID=UPI00313C0B8A